MNPTEVSTTVGPKIQKIIPKEEQMNIDPDKVDRAPSSRLSFKKRLEEMYGVEITLPSTRGGSEVVIKGPVDKVEAAKRDIKESFSCEIRFLIDKDLVGLIKGPNGERVESLKAVHDVRILTINQEGHVRIIGKKSGCEAAKEAIESIINRDNSTQSSKIIPTEATTSIVPRLSIPDGSQIVIKGTVDKVAADKKDIEESSSFETRFFIEKELVGLVIGPKGERIRSLREVNNVKIIINDEGEVQLFGKKSGCEAAKEAIESITKTRTVSIISVEKDYFGAIIGPGGAVRRGLAEKHNVTIFTKPNEGKVVITGEKNRCKECKEAIEAIVEKEKVSKPIEKFYVPDHLLCSVAGRNKANVKRIESAYDVCVSLPSPKNGRSDIWVTGKSAEMVAAAKKNIVDNLPWKLHLAVDENDFGSVAGRGEEMIRSLCNKYGVLIQLKETDGYVLITGKKSRTEAAREAIISIISEKREGIHDDAE